MNEENEGLVAAAFISFSDKIFTTEERPQFDEAKDHALNVWFGNDAWVGVQEVRDSELVPASFLQK